MRRYIRARNLFSMAAGIGAAVIAWWLDLALPICAVVGIVTGAHNWVVAALTREWANRDMIDSTREDLLFQRATRRNR